MKRKKLRPDQIVKVGPIVVGGRTLDPRNIVPFVDKPRVADKDRITVLLTIHHEHPGENPVSFESKGWRYLEHNDVQPYGPRRVTIPKRDTKCDMGWFADEVGKAGVVVIQNRIGIGLLTNPTPEEIEKMKKQILFVRFDGGTKGCRVRPEGFFISEVEDLSTVVLRAADEPVPILLSIYPS